MNFFKQMKEIFEECQFFNLWNGNSSPCGMAILHPVEWQFFSQWNVNSLACRITLLHHDKFLIQHDNFFFPVIPNLVRDLFITQMRC